jgi:hypothetical protein
LTLPPGSNHGFHSKLLHPSPFPVSRLHGVAPPASPFTRCLRLVAHRGRCSPGFRPLQGSPTTGDGAAFTAPSPTHFERPFTDSAKPAPSRPGAPEHHSPVVWLVSPPFRRRCSRLPSFLGFLPLSLFTTFRSPFGPGSWFHLGSRSASPPPDEPSSGFLRFY